MFQKYYLSLKKFIVFQLTGVMIFLAIIGIIGIAQSRSVFATVLEQPLALVSPENVQSFSQKDLDMSEERAKQASKGVFKGLEQAKAQVGDQQTRREAMDYGHEKASEKLENLADRAKAAETPDDLNPADRMFLKNIQSKP
jgi:hypothetical protein